jgi:hypothetical protein
MGSGKLGPEPAAFSGLRFDTYGSAHAFGAFLDDGQANASAWILVYGMQALKYAKNSCESGRVNADTVVLDPEADATVRLFAPNFDARHGSRLRKFYGVCEQVSYDQVEGGFVSEHGV